MSRSYKHTPYFGDTKDRFYKQYANRCLRRKKLDIDYKFNAYKKDGYSWDICDYYWIETENFDEYYEEKVSEWLRWGYKYYPYPEREEIWKEYCKMYLRK